MSNQEQNSQSIINLKRQDFAGIDQRNWGRTMRAKDLPTFYYHAHFVEMLSFVEQHYEHVLEREHYTFLDQFKKLSKAAQSLYVRLVNRKGEIFLSTRLRYPELGALTPLLAELRKSEFICEPSAKHFTDVLRHLTRDSLYKLLKPSFTGLAKNLKKAELIAFTREHCDEKAFVRAAVNNTVFAQGRAPVIAYLSFLYFGRIEDGLNRFAMRDLGLVRVQEIGDSIQPRFSEREEAMEHFFFASKLHSLKRADDFTFQRLIDEAHLWPEPNWGGSATLRDELLFQLGSHFEKKKALETALICYVLGESTDCNERQVRLLLKLNRKEDAKSFLQRCLERPRSDSEWYFARDLYQRKFKAKRTSAMTDLLRTAKVIALDESLMGRPERGVADYLGANNARVFHTENSLLRTLFGLLFWSELFGEAGTGLSSPFDFLPTCLLDQTFSSQFSKEIGQCFSLLSDKQATKRRLLAVCNQHFGKHNGVFRWRKEVIEAIFLLLDHAPVMALQKMLRQFCDNYQLSRYGYPDLTVFDESGVRFVEVKAEGDTLRRNQLLRLSQLQEAGFTAEVLRVHWTIDPNTVYVVIDVETTGGKGQHHRVTEIGATKVQHGEVVDRFTTLLNPQRAIPSRIAGLTGITAQMVEHAPLFSDIADTFQDFMGDAIFVAHNVEFDYGFIVREFERIGRKFRHPKLCTCASMRKLYPGHRSYSLSALCRAYDIPLKAHHRAQCDADAAAALLLLINEKRKQRLEVETA